MTTINCISVGTILIALIAPLTIIVDTILGPPLTQSPENPTAALSRNRKIRLGIALALLLLGGLLIAVAVLGYCPF
jgi:uncharacterized membrane protein